MKKKMGDRLSCFVLALALTLSFCGCDKRSPWKDGSSSPVQPVQEQRQWKTKGFVISEKEGEGAELNVLQYLPWKHEEAYDAEKGESGSVLDRGTCGELVWWLSEVTASEKKKELVLEIQDVSTGESTIKRFSLERLGVGDAGGRLRGMDLIDKDHYVFQWVEEDYDDQGYTLRRTSDRRIYTDLEGEAHVVDLCQSYLDCGLEHNALWDGNCDGRGNTYALTFLKVGRGYTGVCFFDRDGNRILEWRGEQFQSVNEPLRTPEGELIFPVWDSQERQVEYFWADTEEGEMRSLGVERDAANSVYRLYGMQGNDVYYNRAGREIIRWNVESGERTKILSLPRNGLATNVEIGMAFGKEGEYPVLYVRDYRYGKEWLAALTDREVTDRETIRVANVVKSLDTTRSLPADCVSNVSGRNREIFYAYEDDSSEEARTRLLADLSAGNGPDVLYVTLEDMRMLEEKGALLDLGEVLPEDLRDEMLPGALELGTVNGKLVGVPICVHAETLMVSRDVWPKESWSLEDVIALMEGGALEGGVYYSEYGGYFYPLGTMNVLLRHSLGNSFLIDWEKRKSHFDDERFVRLLELTYENRNEGPVDTDTRLGGGGRMAWVYVGELQHDLRFDVDRERENGRYVGYPTSDGLSGNYLFTEGVIVVNAAVKNKEAVRAFLEVASEGPGGNDAGVRGEKELIGASLDENTGKLTWVTGEEIGVFPNNATSIDRANAFLRTCRAVPPTDPLLYQIIEEELVSMYELQRKPKETAEIIHNRVQLYLNEQE